MFSNFTTKSKIAIPLFAFALTFFSANVFADSCPATNKPQSGQAGELTSTVLTVDYTKGDVVECKYSAGNSILIAPLARIGSKSMPEFVYQKGVWVSNGSVFTCDAKTGECTFGDPFTTLIDPALTSIPAANSGDEKESICEGLMKSANAYRLLYEQNLSLLERCKSSGICSKSLNEYVRDASVAREKLDGAIAKFAKTCFSDPDIDKTVH